MNCIICNKKLRSEPETPESDEYIANGTIEHLYCDYGSRFDTCKYEFGICDNCLEKKLKSGRIIEKGKWCGPGSPNFSKTNYKVIKRGE